ncbi:hypothetical protein HK102_010226 [Quaeritorhiza haematococci]|nr:hypothetical protein HK102_010226 [Quaeritorhiza haematococci]
MVLGVFVVYLLGRRICFTSPQEMRTVPRGGWLVAALQFFPIPQMVAGTIGVELVRGFALAQPGELGTVDTLLGGFLATLTTGGFLVNTDLKFGPAKRCGMSRIDDPDFGDGKAAKYAKAPVGTPPVRAWTVVVAANLPVPLYFGIMVTSASGRLGMACGVLLIYWLGRRACHVAREAMVAVIYGGWAVAASQFFPVLQIAAGFPRGRRPA